MMASSAVEEPLLFHYEQSIYSHRVLWYLQLRGIKYSECIQPPYLPRPDLQEGLDIQYRRIPIMAIGRDVYCDSRMIIDALEKRFPNGSLAPKTAAGKGTRKLFENYAMNGGVFMRAVSLLPMWKAEFLKDPKFLKDRSDLMGAPFSPELLYKARPEGLAHLREVFDLVESTFLADGRKWILGDDDGPSIADIDAVYPLQWLFRDPLTLEAVPEEYISPSRYPRTFAWIDRFLDAVKQAKADAPNPTALTGSEAISKILNSNPGEFDTEAIDNEPLGIGIGDAVSVTAGEYGGKHTDHGVVVSLTTHELCIVNSKRLRLHFPRWNFTIVPDVEDTAATVPPVQLKSTMHYHPMSPYSRKVYMVAHELKLTDRIDLHQVVVAPIAYKGWSDNNDEVSQSNPLAKIPTLIPDEHGDGIYDSRLIAEYLSAESTIVPAATAPSVPKQQRWRLKTLQACADGILDAQVLIIYEDKIRAENNLRFEQWVVGQTEKINRGFDRLEYEAARGTLAPLSADAAADPAECAVAACLGFMDIMQRPWRAGRGALKEWFATWEGRASFVATRPDVDWKTGKSTGLGFAAEAISGAQGRE